MTYPVPKQGTQFQTPQPQGQWYPGPAPHDPVYPAGDPVVTPQPPEDSGFPVDANGYTDLTDRKPRPTFRLGRQLYQGKMEVAAGIMMRYSARAAQLQKTLQSIDDPDRQSEIELQETMKLFRLLLVRESADRLIAHLHMIPADATEEDELRINDEAEADEDAVGLSTFMNLLPWLMEQYGMAPTEPSSSASNGSGTIQDDGGSSTQTSPGTGSTSSPSPSTGPSPSSIG